MKQLCPYCKTAIDPADLYACPECQNPHHRECWSENCGCTIYGCTQAPGDDDGITIGRDDVISSNDSVVEPPPLILVGQPTVKYFIARNGNRMGPYSNEEVKHFYEQGMLLETDLAWCEGMSSWLPLVEVLGGGLRSHRHPLPPSLIASSDAIFLYIPTARLVVMSVVTLGFYEVYWIYRNWRFLKERDNLNIQPFWRAMFAVFYLGSLLTAIKNDRYCNKLAFASFSPVGLATGWVSFLIVAEIINRALNPPANILAYFFSIPTFLFLLPVQIYINRVNESLPSRPNYYGWSAGHIVVLIFGFFMWFF